MRQQLMLRGPKVMYILTGAGGRVLHVIHSTCSKAYAASAMLQSLRWYLLDVAVVQWEDVWQVAVAVLQHQGQALSTDLAFDHHC